MIYFDKEDMMPHHWPFVYAHGDLESDNGFDIGSFSDKEPKDDGIYHVVANNQAALVRLVRLSGHLEGRVVYCSDIQAMKHLMDEESWK